MKIQAHRKSAQVRLFDNLDFDDFRAEVGVAQIDMFSNRTECDAIYQSHSTSSFFPTTRHLNPKTIQNILTYLYLPSFIPWNCRGCNYWSVV